MRCCPRGVCRMKPWRRICATRSLQHPQGVQHTRISVERGTTETCFLTSVSFCLAHSLVGRSGDLDPGLGPRSRVCLPYPPGSVQQCGFLLFPSLAVAEPTLLQLGPSQTLHLLCFCMAQCSNAALVASVLGLASSLTAWL